MTLNLITMKIGAYIMLGCIAFSCCYRKGVSLSGETSSTCGNDTESYTLCETICFHDDTVSAYNNLNTFFPVDSNDMLEYADAEYEGGTKIGNVIIKKINIGSKSGTGSFEIRNKSAYFKYKGKAYKLLDDIWICSMKAMDLNSDGQKEILVHEGETYNLNIYTMNRGRLKYCGVIPSNYGFRLINDTIYSLIGTQGIYTSAILEHDSLRIIH